MHCPVKIIPKLWKSRIEHTGIPGRAPKSHYGQERIAQEWKKYTIRHTILYHFTSALWPILLQIIICTTTMYLLHTLDTHTLQVAFFIPYGWAPIRNECRMLDERRHSRRNLGRGCGGLLSSSSGSRFEVGQSINLLRQVKENSIYFFLVSQYAKTIKKV